MTTAEFKKIARLLKEAYKELEDEALKSGVSLLSKDYDELQAKVREAVLQSQGFTLEEYRQAKAKVSGFSQADLVDNTEKTGEMLSQLAEKMQEVDSRHIPDEDEIEEIAERIAKKYIKEPVVINKIVERIKEPKIIKETIKVKERVEYNDKPLRKELESVKDEFKKTTKKLVDEFNGSAMDIKKDIDIRWGSEMPDFRKMAMGLEGRISSLESNGVGGGGTWGSITGTLSNQTDLQSALDAKQATLVSATNIKTINGTSILGSGDLVVAGTIDGSGTTNELTYWVDTDTIGALAVATYPSLTEISYVKGVTSAIQTQLNAKQASDTQLTSLAGLSYTGNALKVIRVNAGETDFELATISSGPSFGTDNQIPYTNAGGTDFDYSANLTFNGTALALAGNQSISQGTITTDVKALDVSSTWNNGAVAFTGIKLNATQTASASTSLLMDLQKDSTSVFKVAKNGAVTIDPGSGFGSGSSNPVLTLRAMYGTSSFYGTASSALAVTGNFQVDGTLQLASGVSFQATGQTVDLNSGNITNLNQITNNGSLSFIKMYHDYNGAAAQAGQGIIMRYANRSAGTYPRAAFQVYNNADSTEIPFMVSSQGFAWLRNSKTDEVALTIKGATSQTANLQNWIDSSDAVLASVAADGNISVPDEAYGAGWNGSLEVPTKNALYDKIETLGGGSGITRTVVVTSGSITLGSTASTDYMYFVAGAHTMSLPAASGNTNRYTIKNNHSANITVDTAGAETIEGAASISVAPEESVDILSDGTNWYIV